MKLADSKIVRRTLIRGLASVGGLAFLSCHSSGSVIRTAMAAPMRLKLAGLKICHSSCAMEGLHCNPITFVHEGRLVKIEASKDFNVKWRFGEANRAKWVYRERRFTMPLLRTDEKGGDLFKPMSWDDALNLIERKIREIVAEFGNESFLRNTGASDMDALKDNVSKVFFDHLGGAAKQADVLRRSAAAAMLPMLGLRYANARGAIRGEKTRRDRSPSIRTLARRRPGPMNGRRLSSTLTSLWPWVWSGSSWKRNSTMPNS